MPYFIYRIHTDKRLEPEGSFNSYREAKHQAKALRADQDPDEQTSVRIIFAHNPIEAERLLLTPREAPVEGDD
ncbi:MAG: hypothetical protein B0D96_03910 [Candidatus Sedimenticola endophacoides]|uniref:Uncharacterized protein n=1 Tax=Candidatus Sedimenticola endophacoides TaxID=2548426 RepID=A0A657PUQ0_9GAMM|nr:MAG: hypothetical protein B0D94_08230 [Candidatus Sedimenticola endophacoides]OQX36563.1 MAG: hypothetical protein B0D96_03910 [Candidatus Sedimenticola endophacoides]OQX41549.1 MAG: hypothetical protein B0D89_03685 [Candidatus Sedimenticola endophacoides]OQX43518.1 MAG: hypothetical protein B0D83_01230 [Candidatus Sedimenticola endophacoides]OQX44122.1 MAG: hypothetical protein B0D86_06345 [Candidatus Sedimenticola endophacoides]